MTAHVHSAFVTVPRTTERPRIAIALELIIDTVRAGLASYRRAHAAHRLERQLARDAAAARREAQALLAIDERLATDLRCAIDRHEADLMSGANAAR